MPPTSRAASAGKQLSKRSHSHGYSSLYISQDLAFADAADHDTATSSQTPVQAQRQPHSSKHASSQAMHAQSQPLLSSSTPDRTESGALKHLSASSSGLLPNNSTRDSGEFDSRRQPHPESSVYSAQVARQRSGLGSVARQQSGNAGTVGGTWVPQALTLGAQLSQSESPHLTQGSKGLQSRSSELRTGQSGLTSRAFELQTGVRELARGGSAQLNEHNLQLSMQRRTERADQVG